MAPTIKLIKEEKKRLIVKKYSLVLALCEIAPDEAASTRAKFVPITSYKGSES